MDRFDVGHLGMAIFFVAIGSIFLYWWSWLYFQPIYETGIMVHHWTEYGALAVSLMFLIGGLVAIVIILKNTLKPCNSKNGDR